MADLFVLLLSVHLTIVKLFKFSYVLCLSLTLSLGVYPAQLAISSYTQRTLRPEPRSSGLEQCSHKLSVNRVSWNSSRATVRIHLPNSGLYCYHVGVRREQCNSYSLGTFEISSQVVRKSRCIRTIVPCTISLPGRSLWQLEMNIGTGYSSST